MNLENRATKVHIMDLAPNEALEKINLYNIPSPHKEILIATCVKRLRAYPALSYLEKEHNINIGYYTFGRRLKEALEMYRKSDLY